jgi:hypothetical protein
VANEREHGGVRMEPELIARIDALARALSMPAIKVTRSDVMRLLITKGLEIVDREGASSLMARSKEAEST